MAADVTNRAILAAMSQSPDLGPRQRAQSLDRFNTEPFDIIVVGGGATGAGCALDAATRGLRVALVEQRDWAAGTSSRSSKLIHGGLRYLEQLEFRLVWEALRERGLMVHRLAPHLVQPIPFIYPLQHPVWERAYVGTGVALYDLLAVASRRPWRRHRHLSQRRALSLFPGLRSGTVKGAIQYWDAQVDDARYAMTLVRTAAVYGAVAATSVRAVGLIRDRGQVRGVVARCLESGRDLEVTGRVVINATGVWADDIEDLAETTGLHVEASKGIHLVVPRTSIDSTVGLIMRTSTSVLFVIPWGAHWLIGTTDTPWGLDKAHPAASRTDIGYLLEQVNRVLEQPIGHADVVGVYAGLRPLLAGEAEHTSRLSREHAVMEVAPGLVTVAGGKYTTYRVMAADAVDAATRSWLPRPPASGTASIPLVGAERFESVWRRRDEIGQRYDVETGTVERLLRRYGSLTPEVLETGNCDPQWRSYIADGGGYLRAEVRYAATHEGALHLDDVLTRRTRLSIEVADRGIKAAPEVARIMAEVLGWDEATVSRELDHYGRRVDAERESQRMPDDRTADAARLGAPDVRMGATSS